MMIVNKTKEYHLVDFIHMLIDDESIEFVDEDVEFVLTLDLIMLLVKDLLLNLVVSDLSSRWIDQNKPYDDHDALAFIGHLLKCFSEEYV